MLLLEKIDCGTERFICIAKLMKVTKLLKNLKERINGRYTAETVIDPDDGEVIS